MAGAGRRAGRARAPRASGARRRHPLFNNAWGRLQRPFCPSRRAHAAPRTAPRACKAPHLHAARVDGMFPPGRSVRAREPGLRDLASTGHGRPRRRHGRLVFSGGGGPRCSWCRGGDARRKQRRRRVAERLQSPHATSRGRQQARGAWAAACCASGRRVLRQRARGRSAQRRPLLRRRRLSPAPWTAARCARQESTHARHTAAMEVKLTARAARPQQRAPRLHAAAAASTGQPRRRRAGAQRPAARRQAPRTPHHTPLPACRSLNCAGCASAAPPVQLACMVKRAPGSTSRAMTAAAAHDVAIKAVGAHRLASSAPQRAAPQRCAANSQPVERRTQRAACAANGRSARRCASIGPARELRAGSALWDAAQPRQPLSPARADVHGTRSSARARGANRLRFGRLSRKDHPRAARRSWTPGMRTKRNERGAATVSSAPTHVNQA